MTVQRRRCEDCGRTLYEPGRLKIIEAARTADGREPAEEFLVKLGESRKTRDVDRLSDVVQVFEKCAYTGDLDVPRELNSLEGDLWELKAGDVRLSFYEVNNDRHGKPVVRLTEGFFKTQWTTQRKHINWGLRVVREDKQYDSS